MTKQFKILDKEPYKFTARDGKVYDKCRYKTDSDVLDIFNLNLEVGKSYNFEKVTKEFNGRTYENWVLEKPKSQLELDVEELKKDVAKLKEALLPIY